MVLDLGRKRPRRHFPELDHRAHLKRPTEVRDEVAIQPPELDHRPDVPAVLVRPATQT